MLWNWWKSWSQSASVSPINQSKEIVRSRSALKNNHPRLGCNILRWIWNFLLNSNSLHSVYLCSIPSSSPDESSKLTWPSFLLRLFSWFSCEKSQHFHVPVKSNAGFVKVGWWYPVVSRSEGYFQDVLETTPSPWVGIFFNIMFRTPLGDQ